MQGHTCNLPLVEPASVHWHDPTTESVFCVLPNGPVGLCCQCENSVIKPRAITALCPVKPDHHHDSVAAFADDPDDHLPGMPDAPAAAAATYYGLAALQVVCAAPHLIAPEAVSRTPPSSPGSCFHLMPAHPLYTRTGPDSRSSVASPDLLLLSIEASQSDATGSHNSGLLKGLMQNRS